MTPALASAVAWVQAAIGAGLTPLEYALIVMRDDRNPVALRLEAAKAALPYCHKKQPQDVNIHATLHMPPPVVIEYAAQTRPPRSSGCPRRSSK